MEIDASLVKTLREKTGVGIMECKTALRESEGDLEEAVKILRKKGLSAAARKASRKTTEGYVGSYIHAGGRIGVLVELNCETDFVARTPEFQELLKDIAMQVAATQPRFVSRQEVTPQVITQEREIFKAQVIRSGKPEHIADKIVDGKLDKFFSETCLLEQPHVRDPSITVKQLLANFMARVGENVQIRRFVRYGVGEGQADGQPQADGESQA
ncbi:MAG: translation elongation factor Ts [Acidobacteriota bacterium]|nr:translation elongation factor Ts [Acidobacteriota bacterium]